MEYDSHHALLSTLAYKNLSPIIEANLKKIGYKTVEFIDIRGAQCYLLSNKDPILGLDFISSTHFLSVSALLPNLLDKLDPNTTI